MRYIILGSMAIELTLTSNQFIECDFLFKYNDGELSTIEQSYTNGYSKIIYSI